MRWQVEGSEESVLTTMPFGHYQVRTMSIEKTSPAVRSLLSVHGYHKLPFELNDEMWVHEWVEGGVKAAGERLQANFWRLWKGMNTSL